MDQKDLDSEGKTGDLLVADFDDTYKSAESFSHLSSVRPEQRFRKPLETREAESTSDAKPVEARNAAVSGIDAALKLIDSARMVPPDLHPAGRFLTYRLVLEEAGKLADEVRRLRAVIQQEHGVDVSWVDEVRRLRAAVSAQPEVCGKMCDHGSECLRQPHGDGRHDTQHGCVFFDASAEDERDRLREENTLLSASLKKQDAELKSVRDEHHDLLVRLRLEPKKHEPYNGY